MYEKKELGLAESLKAVNAIIERAKTDGGTPICAAIVNSEGQLICFARMDPQGKSVLGIANIMAMKKAYTAALWKRNTTMVAARMKELECMMSDTFTHDFTTMQGGVAIVKPGEDAVYGAIGISGRAPDQDDVLANFGLQVIQETL